MKEREYFSEESVQAAPAEADLPIEMQAKELSKSHELGEALWLSRPASATTTGYEGPGWLLAGLMAGNKIAPETAISKAKLLELAKEAGSHPIGHSAHPKKKG